jgi:hypothetical protein
MAWLCPLVYLDLVTLNKGDYIAPMIEGVTGLPVGDHPGAFGVQRKYHIHEGVDLYCPQGQVVQAVEEGVVVAVIPFTGTIANPPSPWWNNTWAVLVEGPSGVVVYGEITSGVIVGDSIAPGWTIGNVKQVLKIDKGRPMSMLHLELHKHGTRDTQDWIVSRPSTLLDPTPFLMELCE